MLVQSVFVVELYIADGSSMLFKQNEIHFFVIFRLDVIGKYGVVGGDHITTALHLMIGLKCPIH